MATATAARTETHTDEQIQKDVLAELKWDARVQPNEIGVAVKDGVVTLTGWVDSYMKKWAAEEAAHRVRGVKAVANDIEVRLLSSSERTDADIAAAAVRALEWDAFVSVDKLDVTVSKGWVTLKGDVEWQFQKEDAERVVRRLSGVKGVTNLIVVRPRVTPSELKQKIEQALKIKFLSPDVYLIPDLPSDLQANDVIWIAAFALLLSLLATLYPSWRASRVNPAEALRYE